MQTFRTKTILNLDIYIMAYVYKHIRLDTNQPFYIGIGADTKGKYTRANRKTYRSTKWERVVNKHGYSIEIVFDNISYDEAKEKEKELIKLYGKKTRDNPNGLLVNITDGGDGVLGWTPSEETRKKWSDQRKGKNFGNENPFFGKTHTKELTEKISQTNRGNHYSLGRKLSDEAKSKMSEKAKGRIMGESTRKKIGETHKGNQYNKGRKMSEETKEKLREINTGRKHSEETVNKMKASMAKYKKEKAPKEPRKDVSGPNNHMYGKKASEETRKKMSEGRKGEDNPFYGKIHSEDTIERLREAAKNQKRNNKKFGLYWVESDELIKEFESVAKFMEYYPNDNKPNTWSHRIKDNYKFNGMYLKYLK